MTTFTLFDSNNIFIGLLVIYLISMFFVDYAKELWALIVITIFYFGINIIWSNFPLWNYFTLKNAGIYIFCGFVFSLFRTIVEGRKIKTPKAKNDYIKYNLKESIFRWIFFFPFSLPNWVLTDCYSFFYRTFGKFYEKLFNL